MRQLSLIIILQFMALTMAGQMYNNTNGARGVGMGGATVVMRDVWAVQNNIAGISKTEHTEVSMFFQNRFGLGGMNYVSLVSALPLRHGSLGVSLDRFGNSNLSEQRFGIGYGHNIDNVSLGFKINVLQVAVKDLGTQLALALEFGGIAELTKELTFGANIYNFNRAKMSAYQDERFSTVMKAGLSYHPFEKLYLNVEAQKNIEYDNDVRFGIDYMVRDKIWVRSGISTLLQTGYFGAGFHTARFNFDYALSYHAVLGFSNSVSFTYTISGNKE